MFARLYVCRDNAGRIWQFQREKPDDLAACAPGWQYSLAALCSVFAGVDLDAVNASHMGKQVAYRLYSCSYEHPCAVHQAQGFAHSLVEC